MFFITQDVVLPRHPVLLTSAQVVCQTSQARNYHLLPNDQIRSHQTLSDKAALVSGHPMQIVLTPSPVKKVAASNKTKEKTKPVPTSQTRASYPIAPVLAYIEKQWDTLRVDHRQLLRAIPDAKLDEPRVFLPRLYISPKENPSNVKAALLRSLSPSDLNRIQLISLPLAEQWDHLAPGLLYLPQPYVVPGGRFQEMYGWDSYFIQEGLLRNGHLNLAKNIVDNQLYEIDHYGSVLNANRTYYLNRSQPPFISRMVLAVYDRTHDKSWLRAASPFIEKQYRYWTSGEHLITTGPAAGLSRYFAEGDGPAIEVEQGEIQDGKTHYQRVKEYFKTHRDDGDYDVRQYYDAEQDQLTPLFYRADRTMRESGFDPSNRFGPFNVDVLNYAPVCLNSLLYMMESDLGTISGLLGQTKKAGLYRQKALQRKLTMQKVLWDDQHGFYADYNVATRKLRYYPFATMFFPLWAGLASPGQVARTVQNLPVLERPGGLMTSPYVTGSQWDAPFAWAPLQDIAVKGLLNYPQVPGATKAAQRIATKFVNTVAKDFQGRRNIFEKYDAIHSRSDVNHAIGYGYSSNEIGFGWTNGVFLELLDVMKHKSASPHVTVSK